ncbi:MAG: Protein involved in biosynthesis of mitomycin antibiotics/polyketide fumonisin [Paenibacillus sp.]|jgi:hypothetical protein|nr:Protein involved in biosynthesis of mitomycin antibiotics/polyketide fumonisin [Paenibacillus sp.]
MQLTYAQKSHFLKNGYVHIPGVVPQVMVDRAMKEINYSVGQGMNVDEMPIFRAQSFCPEIKNTLVIMGLLNQTPALELAESIIGGGKLRPVSTGQVALRFPEVQDPPRPASPHLDGMPGKNNGVKQGKIASFTALVGVLLNDLPNPGAGNFTVWPGSHHIYEAYFQQNGPESLLGGMPPVDLPEPVQITGKAGDVVLAHYLLGHGVTTNVSPNIRYACFFRLYHIDHEWDRVMKDKWLYYPGIREIMD